VPHIDPNTLLAIDPKVFSRVETGLELLLIRPDGSAPPQVLLLKPPANIIWHAAQKGGTLVDAIRKAKASSHNASTVLGIVALLSDLKFLKLDPPKIADQWPNISLDEIQIDPWEFQFSQAAMDLPWFALWEITERCQKDGRCAFCYRAESNVPDPSRGQWTRVLEQISECGVPFITLLGGEPLIHDDVYEIIKALRVKNIFVKLITNGHLVDKHSARRLANAGVNQVAVSLDGLTRDVNDKSRGGGAFDKAIAAIALLTEAVPRVSLSFTVSSLSLEQIVHLPKFCKEHNIADAYISPLRASKQTRLPKGVTTLSPDQSQQLAQMVEKCNAQGLKTIHLQQCSCGRSSMVIRADGRICPCPFTDTDVGNVFDEDLTDLWQKATYQAVKIGSVSSGSFCHRSFEGDAHSNNK
jgi:MoaA/NifB/PqqE/SkfB family radical SAM enzyme